MINKIIVFGTKYGPPPANVQAWSDDPLKLCSPSNLFVERLTGLHQAVQTVVQASASYSQVVTAILNHISTLPANITTYGICCSGGRHRSVVVAREIAIHLFGFAVQPSQLEFQHKGVARMWRLLQKFSYPDAVVRWAKGEG